MSLGVWLDMVDRLPAAAYTPLAAFEQLPARARGDTTLWSERFFTRAVDPNHQKDVRLGAHIATPDSPDLLRREYVIDALRLDVIESINFFLVRVAMTPPILDVPKTQRAEHVQKLAASILQLQGADHRWVFDMPAVLEEGSRFSTDATADVLHLVSWTSRVDGGSRHGQVYFLCYKKFFDRSDFRDEDVWFDEDFRARFGAR